MSFGVGKILRVVEGFVSFPLAVLLRGYELVA